LEKDIIRAAIWTAFSEAPQYIYQIKNQLFKGTNLIFWGLRPLEDFPIFSVQIN